MAEFDFTLVANPTLGGADIVIGTNKITERSDLAIVSVAVPNGDVTGLANALKASWSISFPDANISTVSGDVRAIQTAPDQILLVFPHTTPDAEQVVQGKLRGAGYTTDQSDNWTALEIVGPDTLAALERLCPLDASSFKPNQSARTVMEHMGALILRLEDDRFILFSANSSAASFLHAVETSYHYVAG